MRAFAIAFLLLASSLRFANAQDEAALRRGLVDAALSLRGVPYVYGAESPAAFDCSGFVCYVYRKVAGIELPRSAKAQAGAGKPVAKADLRPGDVLVFDTVGGAPSHVGIYLGEGSMVHAASAGSKTGVIVSSLDDSYYGPRFLGARSFVASAVTAPPGAGKAGPTSPSSPGKAADPGMNDPVAQIGITVLAKPGVYSDKIPAATGTRISFAVTNGTGAEASFTILFFKAAVDLKNTKEIYGIRATLSAGGFMEMEPYLFSEPGLYKLIVKSNGGIQLVERVFRVVKAKQ